MRVRSLTPGSQHRSFQMRLKVPIMFKCRNGPFKQKRDCPVPGESFQFWNVTSQFPSNYSCQGSQYTDGNPTQHTSLNFAQLRETYFWGVNFDSWQHVRRTVFSTCCCCLWWTWESSSCPPSGLGRGGIGLNDIMEGGLWAELTWSWCWCCWK